MDLGGDPRGLPRATGPRGRSLERGLPAAFASNGTRSRVDLSSYSSLRRPAPGNARFLDRFARPSTHYFSRWNMPSRRCSTPSSRSRLPRAIARPQSQVRGRPWWSTSPARAVNPAPPPCPAAGSVCEAIVMHSGSGPRPTILVGTAASLVLCVRGSPLMRRT